MIFVTVGHELGFDRLVKAVDKYAKTHPELDFFAQVGCLGDKSYRPQYVSFKEFISPTEFEAYFEEAKLVIAHAGMGSIITALTKQKPLLIMPRRGHLNETRNDHQVATAKHFISKKGVFLAENELVFERVLDSALGALSDSTPLKANLFASPELVKAVHDFIWEK